MLSRNKAINRIGKLGQAQMEAGSKKWKEEIGYDKQSLVEAAMWHFKGIFGEHFKSIKFEHQETAWYAKSIAINKNNKLKYARKQMDSRLMLTR